VGRTFIIVGLVMIAFGILVTFGEKLPIRLGRLPGDIRWEGKNGSFYFPITTCILLSLIFSVLMKLFGKR
jgi:hypothetical protein